MSILLLWLSVAFALIVIFRVDWCLLERGLPSLGVVMTLMYSLTYGVGWSLWRLDPSSLFGYGTASTIGSLDRLGLLFALALPVLVCSYGMVRVAIGCKPQKSLRDLAGGHRLQLQRLSFVLLLLSVIGLFAMTVTGLFLRNPQEQQEALQASLIAKFVIGTGLLSRLAPVGLVFVPFVWTCWSRLQRICVVCLLFLWTVFVVTSASRGQLLALPLYLLIGAVIWHRLRLRYAFLLVFIGALLFLPVAEQIRVQREGDIDNPALQRKFEAFQIGKQLMGTSHEFYLMLRPPDCAADLEDVLDVDPNARGLLGVSSKKLENLPAKRWHVVRLFDACRRRELQKREFSGFELLPAGLIPSSLFPGAPSLFDGQDLVQALSTDLQLRPGEISQGTVSLFADAWWRWRWTGVALVSAALGVLLALIQSLLLWLMFRQPMAGLLGQLLVLTLVGTWINNTTLTMLWFLFWDLPKAWLELVLLTALLGFRRPRGAT